jgi:SAM-dependent methyltransferase
MVSTVYYADKLETLRDLFGTPDVAVEAEAIRVRHQRFPILKDVIIMTDIGSRDPSVFAEDIQHTFGAEWTAYSGVLPEHRKEFELYFDIVDKGALTNKRVCDLGCGMGRWSYFAKDLCREIVLVDFSDAIFAARKNLEGAPNALFFKCDLKQLPFRDGFADFLFCLGVLHHLPTPCLDEVRALKRFSPRLLIFLYYALDNRPWYFRVLLKAVTAARKVLSRIRNGTLRKIISRLGTWLVYMPLVLLGRIGDLVGAGRFVPLYDFYKDKSLGRIEQDVYDRFFTRIEQRVTRQEILALRNTFQRITISEKLPFWHFVCER